MFLTDLCNSYPDWYDDDDEDSEDTDVDMDNEDEPIIMSSDDSESESEESDSDSDHAGTCTYDAQKNTTSTISFLFGFSLHSVHTNGLLRAFQK